MSQTFSSASNVILNNFSYFLIFILLMLALNWYSFPHSPRPPGFFQVSVSQCALHVCRCQGCFCWLSNPKAVALLIVAPVFVWYNPKWFFQNSFRNEVRLAEIRLKSSLCWKFSRKGWTVFSVGCYFEWRQEDELNDLSMIPQPCDFVIILASSISFSPNTKIKSALRHESV